jgi:hypothetical protein
MKQFSLWLSEDRADYIKSCSYNTGITVTENKDERLGVVEVIVNYNDINIDTIMLKLFHIGIEFGFETAKKCFA